MNKKYLIVIIFNLSIVLNTYGQPQILSVAPSSGPVGAQVTITGTGFDLTPSNNVIDFGGIKVFAESSNGSILTAQVPAGAVTGIVSVTNLANGLSASGNAFFDVSFPFCGVFDTTSYSGILDLNAEYPYFFRIADFDNDGKLDILFASSYYLSFYRNTTSSNNLTFANRVDFYIDQYPESITVNDFNGDGLPDFACTSNYEAKITVFKNISTPGNIAFSAGTDLPVTTNAYYVASGDLDGDGKFDLIASYRYTGNIAVLKNISSGGTIQFDPYYNLTSVANGFVNICDMNNDQKPDLILSNVNNSSIEIFPNNSTAGSISFLSVVSLSTPQGPRTTVCQDMDGDNNPDIMVACSGYPYMYSIFKHSDTAESLVFTRSDLPNSSGAENIFCGDADGDGKPDLISADYMLNKVSVYRNISVPGAIVLNNPVSFTTLENPSCAAIADMNNDGFPELVYANHFGGKLGIRKNNMRPAAPEICMVTVDSTSTNNIIYWDKTQYQHIDSFIILRETTTDLYQKIGAVSFSAPGYFIDTVRNLYFPFTGDPNVGSYRYKLQIYDSCGVYSNPGPYHNSIFMYNIGGTFFWNHYLIEGQPTPVPQLTAYYLYRDNNNDGNWILITAVSGAQLIINDPEYSLYPEAYRRIETGWSLSCSSKATINRSFSNITGLDAGFNDKTTENYSISVFPNPFSMETTIQFPGFSKGMSLGIYNSTGTLVKSIHDMNGLSYVLTREGIRSGFYMLKVFINNQQIAVKKLIITD